MYSSTPFQWCIIHGFAVDIFSIYEKVHLLWGKRVKGVVR